MLRVPVKSRKCWENILRRNSSSGSIRNTFIEYFTEQHAHKHVKSSSVVPLCDPTVPFVNAGMNQFKGVFLGTVDPPCPRAVNSQKCIRVGGKHNDLDVVGTDGHHHTFFEMLGSWSFGDYYKKEACEMAWDLLLGPYRLKPDQLLVTYFGGDPVIGLTEDRECRDIWRQIGVPASRLRDLGASDNFWEMGASGPCGPCTEIHYIHPDGSLTEIWNIVFIQCNREADGTVRPLRRQHVDTGLGLERLAALLQGTRSNYDTDLFLPIIRAIEKNSKGVDSYRGQFGPHASLDVAYRRLADYARMITMCLADQVFPATSLNLKQILRKSFKMSSEVFHNPQMLTSLYDVVTSTLGSTYPELVANEKEAKLVLQHEQASYDKMRADLTKKWKNLLKQYPEVEQLSDVETSGFALGYKEFKESMSKVKSNKIPGELVFKLYDTHGFREELIERVAKLNNLTIDKATYAKLLSQHKSRHKTSFKEQTNSKGMKFDDAIEKIIKTGTTSTNDKHKYDYKSINNKLKIDSLETKIVAILNEDCEWIDILEPSESKPYYIVTEDTNFYCEEGGQIADTGAIEINENIKFKVDSVFKIRDFVFHKGQFVLNVESDKNYVKCNSDVTLTVDSDRRLNIMRNHTAIHLLNAAVKKMLPNSVVYQIGSRVTDSGLSLNLSVYGEKLSQKVLLDAQDLVRKSIRNNASMETRVVDHLQLASEGPVVRVLGETYPETDLRLVVHPDPLPSKELCCGTHVPSAGMLQEFCITLVKGLGSQTPCIHAISGEYAMQARELFCRAEKLQKVIELVDPERMKEEVSSIKSQLSALCGAGGAAAGDYASCVGLLDSFGKRTKDNSYVDLQALAEEELVEAISVSQSLKQQCTVHFLRCSYLQDAARATSLVSLRRDVIHRCRVTLPAMLLGCANGRVAAACYVPEEFVSEQFNATRWLACVAPVFDSIVVESDSPLSHAEMTPSVVSLINCEQQVQDAMRVAIKFAQAHVGRARREPKQNNADVRLN